MKSQPQRQEIVCYPRIIKKKKKNMVDYLTSP